MAENQTKQIFAYYKPYWKKTWNKVGLVGRMVLFLGTAIIISTQGVWRQAFRNGEAFEEKHRWIKERVRDIKRTEFNHLDEELPPVTIEPKTNLELFREEFSKIRAETENKYPW